VIQFPGSLFEACPGPEFAAVRDLLARARRGLHFPPDATAAETWREITSLRGLEAWCALARLLDHLARLASARPIASAGYLPAPRHGSQRRFERALAYIAQRAETGPVYLRDAARIVHLTPAAFSRFFQRFAGETFVRHVNGLRVAKASRLLVETDEAVATIAFACGFENLANFNRRFRALKGVTPLAYRSRFAGPWSRQETSPRRKS
jgi:AraC-like DNA-binding protein